MSWAAPGTGSSGGSTSHLLVLQRLDIQIAFGRPSSACDMAQPGRGEIECRPPVGKRANDAGSPPDLAQNAFERIVLISLEAV
jgi:hypothetical protein